MKYLNPVTRVAMKPIFKVWLRRYKAILEARAAARVEPGVTKTATVAQAAKQDHSGIAS